MMSLNFLFNFMCIKLSLFLFIDSLSIFDTITASKRLWDNRLVSNTFKKRRAYRADEIDIVAWITIEQNIADNFTRLKPNDILMHTLHTRILTFTIENWVIKDDPEKLISRSLELKYQSISKKRGQRDFKGQVTWRYLEVIFTITP